MISKTKESGRNMPMNRHREGEMIEAVKPFEAGREAKDVARQDG
jgi:hypothetical protein